MRRGHLNGQAIGNIGYNLRGFPKGKYAAELEELLQELARKGRELLEPLGYDPKESFQKNQAVLLQAIRRTDAARVQQCLLDTQAIGNGLYGLQRQTGSAGAEAALQVLAQHGQLRLVWLGREHDYDPARGSDALENRQALFKAVREADAARVEQCLLNTQHIGNGLYGLQRQAWSKGAEAALQVLAQHGQLRLYWLGRGHGYDPARGSDALKNRRALFEAVQAADAARLKQCLLNTQAIGNGFYGLKRQAGSAGTEAALQVLAQHGQLRLAWLGRGHGYDPAQPSDALKNRRALFKAVREADAARVEQCLLNTQHIGHGFYGLRGQAGSTGAEAALQVLAQHGQLRLYRLGYDRNLSFEENTGFQRSIAAAGVGELAATSQLVKLLLPLEPPARRPDLLAILQAIGQRLTGTPEVLDTADIAVLLQLAQGGQGLRDNQAPHADGLIRAVARRTVAAVAAAPGAQRATLVREKAFLANILGLYVADQSTHAACVEALAGLAGDLMPATEVLAGDPQVVALLANAWSKAAAHHAQCRACSEQLIERITEEGRDLDRYDGLALSLLLKSCNRLPGLKPALEQHLALHIAERAERLSIQELQTLVAALARRPDKPLWQGLARQLAGAVRAEKLASLSLAELGEGMIFFGRFAQDEACRQVCAVLLQQIQGRSEQLAVAPLSTVTKVLSGLKPVELPPGAVDLGRRCLDRIKGIVAEDPGLPAVNLDDLGYLCNSLTVLFKAPRLLPHKKAALDLLVGTYREPSSRGESGVPGSGLLQIAQRKLDRYWKGVPPEKGDHVGTADVVKCGSMIMRSLYSALPLLGDGSKRANKINKEAERRRREIRGCFRGLRKRIGEALIEGDPTGKRRDFIRYLDSLDDPTGILDTYVRKRAMHLKRQAAPSSWQKKFDALWDQGQMLPIPADDKSGRVKEITVDHLGSVVRESALETYLSAAEFTDGKIPFLRVKLPQHLSVYTLNKTFEYHGVEYRFDLFGGNSAKERQRNLVQQMEGGDSEEANEYGVVWAVPVRESAPGTGFSEFVSRLMPNRQHFWYGHRMLFAHGPGYPHRLDPGDNVLRGKMRVAYIPDGPACPFEICVDGDRQKKVQLRTYDGHGFIKRSVLEKMPAYQKMLALHKEGRGRHYGAGDPRGRVPAQCLRYYPNDAEVVGEALQQMKEFLAAHEREHPGEPFSPEVLHRCFTSGNLRTQMSIAIPSADSNLYEPAAKSVGTEAYPEWDGKGAAPAAPGPGYPALFFRPPYIDEGVRTADEAHVKTPEQGDLTARYLSQLSCIQYTLKTQTRALGETSASMRSLSGEEWFESGHKGLYTVIEDKDWPAEFQDVQVVMPSGDRKTHAHAWGRKLEYAQLTRADVAAHLEATEVYPDHSLVATPVEAWKRSGGDYDGDPVAVMNLVHQRVQAAMRVGEEAGEGVHRVKKLSFPKLFAYLQRREAMQLQGERIELKPPKELTSAFNEYQGLSLATAEKIDEWLGADSNSAAAARLREESVAELRQQCLEIGEMNHDSSPHQWLLLRQALRDWIASEGSTPKSALQQQWVAMADRSGPGELDPALRQRIQEWLEGEGTVGQARQVIAELESQYEARTDFDTAPRTFRKMLDLLDALEHWDDHAPQPEGRALIAGQLDDTPLGGTLYDFSRAAQFMSTRQGLVQEFERWQDIFFFVNSDKRAAVAQEIVKEFYEGLSPETAHEVANLLMGNLEEGEVEERFSQIEAQLKAQREDQTRHADIRRRIGALSDALQAWKACTGLPRAAEAVAAAGGGVDEEARLRERVWEELSETPQQRLQRPENWPEKDPNQPQSWPAYYEQTARLWLKMGSYIGTDIFKTAGETGRAWKEISNQAGRLFRRLEKQGTYGVSTRVPYRKWGIADLVQYGTDPDELLRSLQDCDNLAAGFLRASVEFFKQNYPQVFQGIPGRVRRGGWQIPAEITLSEGFRKTTHPSPGVKEQLRQQIEQRQCRRIDQIPGLIKVDPAEVGGAAGPVYVQIDQAGEMVRVYRQPSPSDSAEWDERYGALELPKQIKRWEMHPHGIIVENPTRQVLAPGEKLHFTDEQLREIQAGKRLLKWAIDARGRLIVAEEIPGLDPAGNFYAAHGKIHGRRLGHPTLTLGWPARISGRIRFSQGELVIDNHSTRYSTYASRTPVHLAAAVQLFTAHGLLQLPWPAGLGKTPTLRTVWYALRADAKGFIEGAADKEPEEEERAKQTDRTAFIENWGDLRMKLECTPPQTDFPHLADFLQQEARYWRGTSKRPAPLPEYDWAQLLDKQLPAILPTDFDRVGAAALRRWSHVFTLLGAARAPAPVVDSLLRQTAQLMGRRQQQLDGQAISSLSYQLRWLAREAGIEAGLGQVRAQLAHWTAHAAGQLGIEESRNDAGEGFRKRLKADPTLTRYLLIPRQISATAFGLINQADDEHSQALLEATAAHAQAQLFLLGHRDDPALASSCLLSWRQIANVIQGMQGVSDPEAMLPALQAHIEHPQQVSFETLDDEWLQPRVLAETVDSLTPHLHRPAARAVVKALYEKTGEPLPARDALTYAEGRGREIYRLLQAAGHLERSQASMRIDLHGCSHHLAQTLTRLALCDPQAPDRLHIVYGEATHVPGNEGKMPSAVQDGIRKAGFDPSGLRFPPGQLVLDKSQMPRTLQPVRATAAPQQSIAASAFPAPASELPQVLPQGKLTQLLSAAQVKLPVCKLNEPEEERDIRGFNDCALNVVLALDESLQAAHRNRHRNPEASKRYQDCLVELAHQMIETRLHPQTKALRYRIDHSGIEESHLTRLLDERGIDVHIMNAATQDKETLTAELVAAHAGQERLILTTMSDQRLRVGDHTLGESHFVCLVPAGDEQWVLLDPNPYRGERDATTPREMQIRVTTGQLTAALSGTQHGVSRVSPRQQLEVRQPRSRSHSSDNRPTAPDRPSQLPSARNLPSAGQPEDSKFVFADHDEWARYMETGLTDLMKEQLRAMAGHPQDIDSGRRWALDNAEYSGAFLGSIRAPDTPHDNISVFALEGRYRKDRPKLILVTPAQLDSVGLNRTSSQGGTKAYQSFRTKDTGNYTTYNLRSRRSAHR